MKKYSCEICGPEYCSLYTTSDSNPPIKCHSDKKSFSEWKEVEETIRPKCFECKNDIMRDIHEDLIKRIADISMLALVNIKEELSCPGISDSNVIHLINTIDQVIKLKKVAR